MSATTRTTSHAPLPIECDSALVACPLRIPTRHGARKRHGSILILTIVVTLALAGMVLTLSRQMRVELQASANTAAAIQADSVERGAEQYVLAVLANEGDAVHDLGEDQFQAIQVGEGYFWIVRPDYGDNQMPLFGLVDESAKLNINAATFDQLQKLPGMTYTAASSIMDWIDTDSNVERDGAEDEYYMRLPQPYQTKNGPLETVEELLMVRGITPVMLYGDGTAAPLGQSSGARVFSSNSVLQDPQIARGLYDLLTIYSVEANTAADGSPRINISNMNRQARNQLTTLLGQKLSSGRANQIVQAVRGQQFSDIFAFYARSTMTADEFDQVADNLTTVGNQTLRGRVNVNTAPASVLACLGNLDSTDADKLVSARPATTSGQTSLAWVADALGGKAIGIGNSITTRNYQYSADIVAASGNGRAFKRVRIVVDTRTGTPTVVYRRDITDRGWPMDPQILASLRAGNAMAYGRTSSFGNMGGGIR
jgi:type II secretory pathway component PulK